MARKGNSANLKPRTQEGLQAALDGALAAGAVTAGDIRRAMMKFGYVAKVVIEGDTVTATSGALAARA